MTNISLYDIIYNLRITINYRSWILLDKNCFDILYAKICESVSAKGFTSTKEHNEGSFSNSSLCYTVSYDPSGKKINLSCYHISDGEPEGESRQVSSWFLDQYSYVQKDIDMICNDFVCTMVSNGSQNSSSSARRAKSKEISNEILFFCNRLVNIFPELKEEIHVERECYSSFRGINFTKNNVLPKIQKLLSEGKDKKNLGKLFKMLNDFYNDGGLDVRGAITMVILNNISGEKEIDTAREYVSDNLKKAWGASMKFKGKYVKPEKEKKINSFMSDTLASK